MLNKHIQPEAFNFDVSPVEIIDCGRRGLDKTAMVKRASAFDEIIEALMPQPNRTYLHVITTGASEHYGANRNGDAYNEKSYDLVFPFPEEEGHTHEMLDGGLSKYHDSTYMDRAHVYQEHKTKDTDPSGEVVAAKYNDDMHRGELIIAVDTDKWAPRLQRKAQGKDIFLSIGAELPRDICLVCGRVAHTFGEHCDHFKKMRGSIMEDGTPCCVMNDSPQFYDISGVDVPADRIAFVLRKVASGAQVKQASAEAVCTFGSRRPMPMYKAALLLDKLSNMEKRVEGLIEGDDIDRDEDNEDDEKAKKHFILEVKRYPADEVIDCCNRKGVLLSPGMLFNILGNDLPEGEDKDAMLLCDDDCCGDCGAVCRELLDADPDERDLELSDGSFDQHFLPDINLERLVEQLIPAMGMDNGSVGNRVIRITITGSMPIGHVKRAAFTVPAEQALRRTYARYLTSFASQNSDATCMNALRKVAEYGKSR